MTYEEKALREKAFDIETKEDLLSLLNDIKADLTHESTYPFTMQTMMRYSRPGVYSWRYKKIFVPKKTGGAREVYASWGTLKWLQVCVNELLQAMYDPSDYAMGFVKRRSVVDNAKAHVYQNYVFNIDLKDFFPSITYSQVKNSLQQLPFGFNEEIAKIIAGLCTISDDTPDLMPKGKKERKRYFLPQGAPSSPVLSNAVCISLDRKLAGLARRFGLTFTRYADDITFSSMHNVYQEGSAFRIELENIIFKQGFRINAQKVRLHHRSRRQEVTGLIVGRKVNVPKQYIKDLRAVLHIWKKYGEGAAAASYYPRYRAGIKKETQFNLKAVMLGKLCYLKMVRGEDDPVYKRLSDQFDEVTSKRKKKCQPGVEYLGSCTLKTFERRMNVVIDIGEEVCKNKFTRIRLKNGTTLPIYISRLMPPNSRKDRVWVSLCRRTFETGGFSVFYMLHNSYAIKSFVPPLKSDIFDETVSKVVDLVVAFPILNVEDECGVIQPKYIPQKISEVIDQFLAEKNISHKENIPF